VTLPFTTRISLSLSSLAIGYTSGIAVMEVLRVVRWRYVGIFAFGFGFHVGLFALMTSLGWLTFLLPFVVIENRRRAFRKPLGSALAGGIAGSCLVMILLVSLLGRSALAFPNYGRACAGYALCAFATGFVSTGSYVLLRNQKEDGTAIPPSVTI